ncbi:MAG: L,D-transpeptidase family protein [Methylococcales bacterium]
MIRFLILFFLSFASVAETFPLPPSDLDLIGEIGYTKAAKADTLLDIARRFDLGQNEIVEANPDVDRWMPGDNALVMLPKRYILPDAPRTGLVINVSEMRIYYFPATRKNEVVTYPISVGRMDWNSPLGFTRVVEKKKDPSWTPPESIKIEHAAMGDPLPDVVPPGPNNPLGAYALKLAVSGYLIHGTDVNKSFGIGMRVTHGCIRLYPEDIEILFPEIEVGTQVNFVDQPIKLGWFADTLYVEVHAPLEENEISDYEAMNRTMARMQSEYPLGLLNLDSGVLQVAVRERSGMPVAISHKPDIESPRYEPEDDITSR